MRSIALALSLSVSLPSFAAVGGLGLPASTSPSLASLALDPSLSRARSLMSLVGVEDLADAGTIDLSTISLSPGVYALSQSSCGFSSFGALAGPPAPPAAGLGVTCTAIPGWFSASAPTAFGGLYSAGSGTVVQYTGDTMSDIAVLVADHVIFEDATLTLSSNVRELWIIARSIESSSASITWSGAGATAAGITAKSAAAAGSPSYNPTAVSSASAFRSPSGGAGQRGVAGSTGNAGRAAPDVHVVVLDVLAGADGVRNLPVVNLRGEAGGAGQSGQAGGRGGHGAKGANAVANLVNCVQGAGWGGDGGAGGSGGVGGRGGDGGAGGDLSLWFVNGLTPTMSYTTTGGAAGGGGAGGAAGAGGTGGSAGNASWPYCREEPTRAGRNGASGTSAGRGASGAAGAAGVASAASIDVETWEALFTQPWLAGASDPVVQVGAPLQVLTENVTGGARLRLVHATTGTAHLLSLVDEGAGVYTLEGDVTGLLDAGVYTASIVRDSDGAETENLYEIELLPVLHGVHFADAFDALPNGQAIVEGSGLVEGLTLLWDGVALEVLDAEDLGATEEWTVRVPSIPVDAEGKFLRDDGATLHDVSVVSPWPWTDADANVQTTLLRHDGLTFLPSVNGYSWSNGDMTDVVKDTLQADLWGAFEETFGGVEIDASMLASPLGTGALFGLYGLWWADSTGSANCLGMSTNVLADFFDGVTGVPSETRAAVAHTIGITQGKLLSQEVLGGLIDSSQASLWVERPVFSGLGAFFADAEASDADEMPVLVMIPDVHLLEESLINALLPEALETGESSFTELNSSIGGSHALAPYLVAYANRTDSLPTRIYVYDSNAAGADGASSPAADGVFLTLQDDGLNLTWSYDFFEATSPDYTFGSAGGWTMASVSVGTMLGDVSLLGNLLD